MFQVPLLALPRFLISSHVLFIMSVYTHEPLSLSSALIFGHLSFVGVRVGVGAQYFVVH